MSSPRSLKTAAIGSRSKVAPRRNDPILIGYAFCDCPILTEAEAAAHEVQIFGARGR